MRGTHRNLLAILLGVLLVGCGIAAYFVRQASPTAQRAATSAALATLGDPLLDTARKVSALADTADEQVLAREALRLADHEVDQAFASALREAAAAPLPTKGPLKQLADRIDRIKARIAAEQDRIAKLTKPAETDEDAADELEILKAQVALDEDELEDAQQELIRQGGDRHARIQSAIEEHDAARQGASQLPKLASSAPIATLSQQIAAWFGLGDRQDRINAAGAEAAQQAASLKRQHDSLEKSVQVKTAGAADTDDPAEVLRNLSGQRKTIAELDKRIQNSDQLSGVYRQWSTVVGSRRQGVLHSILVSLTGILATLFAVVLIDGSVRRAFRHSTEWRKFRQLQVVATIVVQGSGAMIILLLIFGVPTETSTIIGLATAGLTVALKDFIVAFFGWFALLGRNGIRVGDWVEIEGVSGEVIEIGLLKTVLLEVGNWTAAGRPTGRRVAFMNTFAIENHYFNFSTAGQWLWDELQFTLPEAGDPYELATKIRELVESLTAEDTAAAERDWERVTRQYEAHPFSAKPTVNLRPAGGGLEVVLRYITRAPQRSEVKSKLYETIVNVIRQARSNPATANT